MSIAESLGKAAAQIGNAAEEAAKNVKKKYEETVTPEKREEIKQGFDKGVNTAEKALDSVSDAIERGIKGFTDGYKSAKK